MVKKPQQKKKSAASPEKYHEVLKGNPNRGVDLYGSSLAREIADNASRHSKKKGDKNG